MRPPRLVYSIRLPSAFLLALFSIAGQAHAQSAQEVAAQCRKTPVDDRLQPIPDELVAPAQKLFGAGMPAESNKTGTVFRCMGAKVWLCNVGANLVCDKANARHISAGATNWCKEYPNSQTVPMSATGHDTLYNWTCVGRSARIAGNAFHLDRRGFIRENWRRLP